MNGQDAAALESCSRMREEYRMIRSLFDQMYDVALMLARYKFAVSTFSEKMR